MQNPNVIDSIVSLSCTEFALSQTEIQEMLCSKKEHLHSLLRNCSLAVLNSGSKLNSDIELLETYKSFTVKISLENYSINLELKQAPASAFIDGILIEGIKEHLFSVLRDLFYTNINLPDTPPYDPNSSKGITNSVFHTLRHANLLTSSQNLVVCWGGHSISSEEYNYSHAVGEQLGLRKLDICTGCGEGSMKGPMEGASIGHSKQRIKNSRYLGITEPKIIAVESPNPIVNKLVILPNIEQRLEAFVRIGHAVIVFPGGVGTTEEILYLIGILMHPENTKTSFPVIFTGPKSAEKYFGEIDLFLKKILPPQFQNLYKIIINNPELVAKKISISIKEALKLRQQSNNSPNFNWNLKIDPEFQQAFNPTHENMAKLNLRTNQEPYMLLANLRRAFSGIVSGNITEKGILSIKKHGKFRVSGDPELMIALDGLLQSFVKEQRMSLQNKTYTPCYEIEQP